MEGCGLTCNVVLWPPQLAHDYLPTETCTYTWDIYHTYILDTYKNLSEFRGRRDGLMFFKDYIHLLCIGSRGCHEHVAVRRQLEGGRVCMCVYLSSGTFTCVKCVYLEYCNIQMMWNEDTCIVGSAASRAILLQKNNTSHICNLTCPSRGWDMLVVKEHLLPLQKHPPRTGLTASIILFWRILCPSGLCRHRHVHSAYTHTWRKKKNT